MLCFFISQTNYPLNPGGLTRVPACPEGHADCEKARVMVNGCAHILTGRRASAVTHQESASRSWATEIGPPIVQEGSVNLDYTLFTLLYRMYHALCNQQIDLHR